MAATAQAQQAIDALKAAGFKRSEFQVRTEIHRYTINDSVWTGEKWVRIKRQVREHGDAKISLRTSKARCWSLIPAMLEQGLSVTVVQYTDNDGHLKLAWHPMVKSDGRGRLRLWDTALPCGEQIGPMPLDQLHEWIVEVEAGIR